MICKKHKNENCRQCKCDLITEHTQGLIDKSLLLDYKH